MKSDRPLSARLRETELELREDYRPLAGTEQSVKAARDFVQEHLYPAIRTDPALVEVYAEHTLTETGRR